MIDCTVNNEYFKIMFSLLVPDVFLIKREKTTHRKERKRSFLLQLSRESTHLLYFIHLLFILYISAIMPAACIETAILRCWERIPFQKEVLFFIAVDAVNPMFLNHANHY